MSSRQVYVREELDKVLLEDITLNVASLLHITKEELAWYLQTFTNLKPLHTSVMGHIYPDSYMYLFDVNGVPIGTLEEGETEMRRI